MAEMDVFEAMYSARALRRFKPDPVPDEVLTKVLDAAIRAPSGSNEQSWLFVVVKDAAQRKKLGDIYRKGGDILFALYANRTKPEHMAQSTFDKLMASATYLVNHMADAPVLLVACLKQSAPSGPPPKLSPEILDKMRGMVRMSGSTSIPPCRTSSSRAARWASAPVSRRFTHSMKTKCAPCSVFRLRWRPTR